MDLLQQALAINSNPYGNISPFGAYSGFQANALGGGLGSPFGASPFDSTSFSPLSQSMGGIQGQQQQQLMQMLMLLLLFLIMQQMMSQNGQQGGPFGSPGGGGCGGGFPGGGGPNGVPGNRVPGNGYPGNGYPGNGGPGGVGGNRYPQSSGGGANRKPNDTSGSGNNGQPLPGNVADRIEAVGRTQLGDPYVFGAPRTPDANNPSSFDCSSFTQWTIRQATGKMLPGTAETQYDYVRDHGNLNTNNWGNWHKGDLIFFEGTYKPGISHVGIYIGNGKMIQAGGDHVQVSDLAHSSYYRQHYAGSGRA